MVIQFNASKGYYEAKVSGKVIATGWKAWQAITNAYILLVDNVQ